MTPIQYLVLIILETKNSLKVSDLIGMIGVVNYMFLGDINSLIFNPSFNPKKDKTCGIISCDFAENEPPIIKDSHTISINMKFLPQNLKINSLPGVYKKSTKEVEEERLNEEKANKAREDHIILANLARIMKSRIGKLTKHSQLVSEVAKQITLFQAQPDKIKHSIEALIDKGVLKRDPDDNNSYQYIS